MFSDYSVGLVTRYVIVFRVSSLLKSSSVVLNRMDQSARGLATHLWEENWILGSRKDLAVKSNWPIVFW
jgi:hypothetical protein